MMNKDYNFKAIETKWQKRWKTKKAFEVKEDKRKKKFYVLEMYPYPSGSGLHMGHAFNYTIGDIFTRLKRMQGYNVLYPMGYDSFGLPAENAAIKEKIHPKKFTDKAVNNFIKQQKALGLSYDWSRILMTHHPEYYRWNQFFFLKFLERGLVYRKKAPVNWCPKCNTVLANEQVHNGKCWRHTDTNVEIRHLEQWFINTSKYSGELLEKIENIGWPNRIKLMQKNWIGRSEGVEIIFSINSEPWKIFTTRPDTIYGVTFLVISAQHEKLMSFVTDQQKQKVEVFLKKIKSISDKSKRDNDMEKDGVFTGSYAINPINGEKIPVYVGNFVVADYGSGVVMGVPAHDQRDFEFAVKYNIPIRVVVEPKYIGSGVKNWMSKNKFKDKNNVLEEIRDKLKDQTSAYVNRGFLVNSGNFNGLSSDEAAEHITKALEFKKLGKKIIQYKFRDWLVSRQRYWGTPIPVIYCDECGVVPVPEKDLPVILPEKVKFGKGNPLESNKKFLDVRCPKCKGKARRETDTMDTFFDSSWYYLRYCDPKNNQKPFTEKMIDYWMPVNQYIGGAEHATMHLIYARFFTKALRDIGFLEFDEPFMNLFNQGMLHGSDGFVMSKSRGNVVLPEEISKKYGIDTARFFLVSMASPDKDVQWSKEGIEGSMKFIHRVMNFFQKPRFVKSNPRLESKINKKIIEITEDIENFRHNMATIRLRELFSQIESGSDKRSAEIFLKLLSLFCPHIAEEFWEKLGNKSLISLEKWPVADEKKINEKFEKEEEMIEKTINDINNIVKIITDKGNTVKTLYLYVVPAEIEMYNSKEEDIVKRTDLNAKVFSVADKEKYDPDGKSRKAKPGKPGIYLE